MLLSSCYRRERLPQLVWSSAVLVLLVAGAGCGQLGYSSRVLHRLPSPDGRLVAVCQEIPEFDAPGYDLRVDDRGGRRQARLFRGFDADQCDEIVWAADGSALAVLTRYRALLRIIDVRSSLARPAVLTDTRPLAPAFPRSPFVTESDFSADGTLRRGRGLRFVSSTHFEVTVCAYDWEHYRQTRQFRCTEAERTESIAASQPQPSRPAPTKTSGDGQGQTKAVSGSTGGS
jgi:hypothetical protein